MSIVRAAWSAFRGYLSAALLGVFAIVLLVLGSPAKAALAGAGFAFVGATITRGIDIAKECRAVAADAERSAADAEASRRRDLDETRRLAYAMLASSGEGNQVLAGTLINAFVHHGLGVDRHEAQSNIRLLSEMRSPDAIWSARWLRSLIDDITEELES